MSDDSITLFGFIIGEYKDCPDCAGRGCTPGYLYDIPDESKSFWNGGHYYSEEAIPCKNCHGLGAAKYPLTVSWRYRYAIKLLEFIGWATGYRSWRTLRFRYPVTSKMVMNGWWVVSRFPRHPIIVLTYLWGAFVTKPIETYKWYRKWHLQMEQARAGTLRPAVLSNEEAYEYAREVILNNYCRDRVFCTLGEVVAIWIDKLVWYGKMKPWSEVAKP